MLEYMTTTFLGKIISTFFMAMVPIIELRGAIPWGVAHDLPIWVVYITGVLGNVVPVPFILLFLRHLFQWLKKYKRTASLVVKLEKRAHLKGSKVTKYKSLGLFVLVAIPLPGTGAWTGALVASVLDIPLKKAFPIITLGVCAAGIAMMFLSYGVKAIV